MTPGVRHPEGKAGAWWLSVLPWHGFVGLLSCWSLWGLSKVDPGGGLRSIQGISNKYRKQNFIPRARDYLKLFTLIENHEGPGSHSAERKAPSIQPPAA